MQNVKVTADEFRELRNPYTGEPMDVWMLVGAGPVPLFHCAEGEYATQDRFPTAEEAALAWSRRDGVEGMASPPFVCAYTGEVLSASQDEGGFAFSGGFNPKMLYPRDEFLYRAAMRDGVSPFPKPGPARRVEKPAPEVHAKASRTEEPTDEMMEHADRLVRTSGLFENGTAVTVKKSFRGARRR